MQTFKFHQWLPILIWLLTAIVGFGISFYWCQDVNFALADGFANATALSLTTWVAQKIMGLYPTHVAAMLYSVFIGCLAGFVAYSLASFLLHFYQTDAHNPFVEYSTTEAYRILLLCITASSLIACGAMKRINDSLDEKMNRIADVASLHKEAELFKLRQQIQPHFLFNSLNSINALILINPNKAQDMIGKLSDFLRISVKRDTEKEVLLTDEIAYINTYLDIETIRFSDRLKIEYNEQFSAETQMPPFLLQPIIENAIKFGLYGTTEAVTIKISILEKDSFIQIRVENPFQEATNFKGTGFGLEGIRRRLYLLYGRTDLLQVNTANNNFITELSLPKSNV